MCWYLNSSDVLIFEYLFFSLEFSLLLSVFFLEPSLWFILLLSLLFCVFNHEISGLLSASSFFSSMPVFFAACVAMNGDQEL